MGVLLASLAGSSVAFGQELSRSTFPNVRNEINVMVGMVPYALTRLPGKYYRDRGYGDLYDLYDPYYLDSDFSPVLTVDYSHYFSRWFKAGVTTGFSQAWADRYDPMAGRRTGTRTISDFNLMGQMKFTYLDKSIFKMYSGLAAGGTFRYVDDDGNGRMKYRLAGEVIPLGFMWTDHRVYGIFETAVGSRMLGMRIGLGCRF